MVLVTFAFTSTDASCNSDFNFDSLIDTALDAGHQISATVPKHANKVATWLKNKAKHPKLRAWIESIVADLTPPPKKAATTTKATSASFTLGDWVEVQVLDKAGDATGEWQPAQLTGLHLDGRFDLTHPDGRSVRPALESGIRKHHLRMASTAVRNAALRSKFRGLQAKAKLQETSSALRMTSRN